MNKSFAKLLLGIILVFISFAQSAIAQNRSVTIQVLDADGPIAGASIAIKGTTQGNITGVDGKVVFNNLNSNSILLISYIGYVSQEITVGTQSNITVTLSEDILLVEEVVVVGYGVQKRSQVTGAISQVKSEDMENRAFSDATQALQGKTSGVQIFLGSGAPGTIGSVRIRGLGSNGSNDPLYVVDGRIVSDIGFLDVNDIASMEVLKDASSAAIYGARAGSGVILITTKQGENRPTGKIEYRFQYASQKPNNLPKMLGAKDYYDYQLRLSEGNKTALDIDWGDKKTDTDWLDYIYGTGYLTRHNITLSGGKDDITYYIAGSALSNDGPMITSKDKYDRYTATFNGSYKVKKWISINTNNNFSVTRTNGRNTFDIYYSSMRMTPLITPTVKEPTEYMNVQRANGYNLYTDKNGEYATLSTFPQVDLTNPVVTLNRTRAWEKSNRISGTTSLILTPIVGLTYTSRLGYIFFSSRDYTQTLPGVENGFTASYNQTVNARDQSSEEYQWENFANYNKSFGKHNTTVMAGMSYMQSQSSFVTGNVAGTGRDIGWPDTDPLNAYFAYTSGGFNREVTGGAETTIRRISYYGRLNYDYDNKYYVQASLRADAADLAYLPSSGRWGYFPGASLGWTISNEDFMKDYKAISHLRLRGSWGQNGSIAGLSNYAWQSVIQSDSQYPFAPGQLVYITGRRPSSAGNESLKWETYEQFSIGFDARFLKNRLSFSYDLYKKSTIDLILTGIVQSYLVGITTSPFNAGKMENKGHEIEVGWKDNIKKDFRYSINANFSTTKNKVAEITSSLSMIAGYAQDTQTITYFEKGYPIWHFKTYQYLGPDENGNPKFLDVNNDGVIDPADRVDCGSGLPTYNYGLTISAAYKNFDISIFGSGQGGNKIFQTLNRGSQLASNIVTRIYEDAWTENNRNASVPKVGMENNNIYFVSSSQLFKGDFFKLKQLQIGYSLPKDLIKKISVENLRVYLSGENLFTFTNYPGSDPEIMSFGNGLGVDFGRYPNNKSYIVGVNVTF